MPEFWEDTMRRLCLTVGLSAMLALPLWAQQGAQGTRDVAKNAAAANAAESTNAVPAASRNSFAVPLVPRATPFPGPAAASSGSDEGGPGKLVPKFELA